LILAGIPAYIAAEPEQLPSFVLRRIKMKCKLFVFAAVLSTYSLFIIGFSLADSRGYIAGVFDQAGLTTADNPVSGSFIDPTPEPPRPVFQQIDPTPEPPRPVMEPASESSGPVVSRIDPTPEPPRP
jgi:hypothetical protein